MTDAQIEAAKAGVRDEYGSHLCAWTDAGKRVCRKEINQPCLCREIGLAALTAAAEVEETPTSLPTRGGTAQSFWSTEIEPSRGGGGNAAAAEVGPDEKLIERCKRLTKDRNEIEARTIKRCARVLDILAAEPSQPAIKASAYEAGAAALRALEP